MSRQEAEDQGKPCSHCAEIWLPGTVNQACRPHLAAHLLENVGVTGLIDLEGLAAVRADDLVHGAGVVGKERGGGGESLQERRAQTALSEFVRNT